MRTAPEILEILQTRFGDRILASDMGGVDPFIVVASEAILEVCEFLKEEESLAFESLMCLSGVDYKGMKGESERIEVVYHLFSVKNRHQIVLKVRLPREAPAVSSVETVWAIANWHEREAYDMLGVEFRGHSDPRRILCPDDWVGFPLRKDYVQPETYRGMPVAPGKQFAELAQEGKQLGTDPFSE
jgi:NADH-quinone oxidoreductase subunit C